MSKPITIEFSLNESEFLQNYEIEVKNNPQFDFLIINNAPSTNSGLELISQPWFKSKLSSLTNLFAIKLKINEKIDDLLLIDDCGIENLVLIAFQSTTDKCESKTHWKVPGNVKFYSLHVDEDLTQELSSLCHVHLMKLLKDKDSGVLREFQDQSEVRLDEICSNEKENFLMFAVLSNQPSIVQELLNRDFDVNFANCEGEVAIDYAWTKYTNSNDENDKNTASNIILQLLKMNSELPIYFDYSEASKEVQEFVDMCESLHRDLDDRNFDSLNEKLDQNPNLTYFYDRKKTSLLLHALKMSNSNDDFILSLIKRGLNYGPCEELLKDVKIKLKRLHLENLKECPEVHILKLRSRTFIGNNHQFPQHYWNLVDDAYKTLESNKLCSKMLKVAAESKYVKFYFDFKHDTVYYMDPTGALGSKGRTHRNGTICNIFVGAKYLRDENRKFLVLSYLAHELCHVVMLLTFFNPNFDPFPMGESTTKTRYIDVVMTESKIKKDFEEIVKNVFGYEEKLQPSELVVTVVQMMMHYLHNEVKLQNLRGEFKELFGYVEEIVEPELEKAIDVLKWLNDKKRDIKFKNLTEPMKARISHKEINLQGQKTTFFELIESDSQILDQLTAQNIRDVLIKNIALKFAENYKLKLLENVIERNFSEQNVNKQIVKSFEQIKESKVFILADYSGKGKSTEFTNSAMNLKKENINSWVELIDVGKHREVLDKFTENFELIDFLLKIINPKSEIEKEIFKKLFRDGKVILLFDGVDEVFSKYETIMMTFFNMWKEGGTVNQLWISTRPFIGEKIKEIFNVAVHNFKPFTIDEKRKLIDEILKGNNFTDYYHRKRSTEIFDKWTQKLSKKIEFNNPLIIKMLIELFIYNSQSINVNNRHELYSAMINKKKEQDAEKVPVEDRDILNSFSIWQSHKVYAMKLIFGDDYQEKLGYKLNELKIVHDWQRRRSKFPNQKIQRYGFLTIYDEDDRSAINFLHRSFAEFFIAEYFIDFIYINHYGLNDDEIERNFKLLELVMTESEFEDIGDFIFGFIQSNLKSGELNFNEVDENIKTKLNQVILNGHDLIDNLNYPQSRVAFERYAKIASIDVNIARKFWGIEPEKNIIKSIMPNNDQYSFKSVLELAVQCLDVSCNGKIFDQKLNATDECSKLATKRKSIENLTKVCEIMEKELNFEPKIFYKNFDMFYAFESKSLTSIISRMRAVCDKKTLANKFMVELDYFGISDEVVEFALEEIKDAFSYDKESITKFLYEDLREFEPPLNKAYRCGNSTVFNLIKNFYIEYKNSWKDIQEIFINSYPNYFFIGRPVPFFEKFKEFVFEVFAPDKAKAEEIIDKYLYSKCN